MKKQEISISNKGEVLTVSTLTELLVNKLLDGTLDGSETISDYENVEWCLMGFKKRGPVLLMDFEEGNDDYIKLLEEEPLFEDYGDVEGDIDETFNIIDELENSNDDIIETVGKLGGDL